MTDPGRVPVWKLLIVLACAVIDGIFIAVVLGLAGLTTWVAIGIGVVFGVVSFWLVSRLLGVRVTWGGFG